MESKIIKAFFDGNLADEVITTPRTRLAVECFDFSDVDENQ